jgi:hypothetical protein
LWNLLPHLYESRIVLGETRILLHELID